jgi:hypothetical protein
MEFAATEAEQLGSSLRATLYVADRLAARSSFLDLTTPG